MRPLVFALFVVFAFDGLSEQPPSWQPSPGHQWIGSRTFELSPDVPVTRQTPPTFLLQAENDDVDTVKNSLVYYIALKNAGVPVEMHLFAEGKHAFGLRPTKFPITHWPELVETWLGTIGMISNYVRVFITKRAPCETPERYLSPELRPSPFPRSRSGYRGESSEG